jgi:uncharacterized protein YcfJ
MMGNISSKLKASLILTALPFFLVSCAGDFSKQDAGMLIGGASGALIGSQFGHGSGRAVGAGVGAVAGGLVGSQIGKSMDQQDAMRRERVVYVY